MKTYYFTLSKVFPSTHAKAGMNTCFEEKLRVYKLRTWAGCSYGRSTAGGRFTRT